MLTLVVNSIECVVSLIILERFDTEKRPGRFFSKTGILESYSLEPIINVSIRGRKMIPMV